MLPLESLIANHRELGLVIAVLIGFGFGFVLERAGFGRASKLAAQFYLHDMTVFKVMFGAIITAMSGMMLAQGLGLVDLRSLSESAVSYTYIWPMLVGGLVLGAGFIISGYCPGTSVVGMASGNLDAIFAYLGVIVGSVIYGEIFPVLAEFHQSGEMGPLFLYDLLRIPPPVLAAIVVLMAIAMFIGAEKVERIFKRRRSGETEPEESSRRPRALAFGTIAGLALIAVATLALPIEPEASLKREPEAISTEQLAPRSLEEPWSLRILDMRERKECEKARIPGAECAPAETVGELGLPYGSGARDLVLIGRRTAEAPGAALSYPGKVLVLEGGWEGWKSYALDRPELPGPEASASEIEDYKFRAALNSAMTGRKPPPPPPASGKHVPQKKKKKGGGCS